MSENPLLVAPRERVVEIYPGDVEAQLAALEEQIAVAQADDRPRRASERNPALALAEEYDALVEATRERAVKVTLRAVPHRVYRQLQDAHPPRKGSKRDEVYGVNEDSFFPALIKASLISPEVTDEQWDEFVATVAAPALLRLSQTAFELATGEVALPKSSAVSVLRRMRESDSRRQPVSEPAPEPSTASESSNESSTTTQKASTPATA